jgi:hypothetical protein
MGMIVSIYRNEHRSELNLFDKSKGLCIVNVEGPFKPCEEYPPATLVKNGSGWVVRPFEKPNEGRTPYMDGGSYASTCDSRWTSKVGMSAVPIHDRSETWEAYDRLSR